MEYIDPSCDVVHIYGLTVGRMLDQYMETPDMCLSESILRYSRLKLFFPCTYVLNKPKQRKKSVVEPSYEESYRGRPTRPSV